MKDEREFLRKCFLNGSLDISGNVENMCEFLELFKRDVPVNSLVIELGSGFLNRGEMEKLYKVIDS